LINDGDIQTLGQFIINELGNELIKQNHRATGNLIASLDYAVENRSGDLFSLIVTSLPYGGFVDRGRKAGGKKVPINVLVEWIKQKGIETNNKKILGIAFAIQNKIHKEGSPTKGRVKKYGKGVDFIDDTLKRINKEIERRIADIVFLPVEISINNLVKRI
jgi:hypothetical protein